MSVPKTLPVAVFSLCLALYAGVVVRGWPHLGYSLSSQTAPLAWLQNCALVACATTAAVLAGIARRAEAGGWALLALGVLAAALDDRFMFHEWVQAGLGSVTHGALRWFLRHAAFGCAVAACGLVAGWWLKTRLGPAAWRWVVAGIAVGVCALAMDVLFTSAAPQAVEESLEFLAESLLLAGLLGEVRHRAGPRG